MSEEYSMSPETADRYHAHERALHTRVIENKTMVFRLKGSGEIETRIIREKNVDPSELSGGWVDSAAKCVSPEMYELALQYPDRRAGQLRAMLKEKGKNLQDAVSKAVSETDDRAVLEAQYHDVFGRRPHPSASVATLRAKIKEGAEREAQQS